jgi:hypothetical protein
MNTTLQRVALGFGSAFILVAILGFVVAGGSMNADLETAPRVLGLFPVNLLHNVVHLAFGAWGLLAARSYTASLAYTRGAGAIYLVLAALGFVAPTTFGLIPIGGNDIWLHLVMGGVLAFFGFTARTTASQEPSTA